MSHDIVFNTKKTVCMYIKSKKLKLHTVPNIYLNHNVLEYATSYKYLGCTITDTLNDHIDIQRTIRGIYARSNMLIRKYSHCSSHVKRLLFKTYCKNVYCTQLWWSYSNECLRKIRVAFNNSFRFLMGYSRRCSASGMFIENNIDDFNILRRKYMFRFICRLQQCNNSLIINLFMYRQFFVLPSVTEWYRTLYSSHVTEFLYIIDILICFGIL